jgi:signal transduction histidine kinase
VVEVRDDGIGGAEIGAGGGLECLSDRAAALGGSFALESPKGGGTTVRIELPVV